MFENFDVTYVINLPEREDRKREMQAQMRQWSIADFTHVRFFDAVRMETAGPFVRQGSHGAYLSYLEVLRLEAGRGTNVLILQDDCNFTSECRATIPNSWDIFYGGYEASDPSSPQSSNIIGAHCMGFKSEIIGTLATFLDKRYVGHSHGDDPLAPIDGSIVDFRRKNPAVESHFRKVSYQRSSRTDIGDLSLVDRLPVIARSLRKVRNALRR